MKLPTTVESALRSTSSRYLYALKHLDMSSPASLVRKARADDVDWARARPTRSAASATAFQAPTAKGGRPQGSNCSVKLEGAFDENGVSPEPCVVLPVPVAGAALVDRNAECSSESRCSWEHYEPLGGHCVLTNLKRLTGILASHQTGAWVVQRIPVDQPSAREATLSPSGARRMQLISLQDDVRDRDASFPREALGSQVAYTSF